MEADREQAELRASRDRLAFLIAQNPAIVYTTRPDGDFAATFVGESVRDQLGYEPCEFTEDPGFWARHIHPDDAAGVFARLSQLFEHGTHIHEYRFQAKDGTYRWMRDQLRLIRDPAGEPLEIVGYWVDVTEWKLAADALLDSEQRFRTLTRHAPVGIFTTDENGDCLFVNERWCEFAGMTPAQAQRKGWLDALHPEDRDRVIDAWYCAARSGSEFVADYRFLTPDGRVTWLHGTATEWRSDSGEMRGYVGILTDLSERAKAEEERRALEVRLQQSQKLESLGVLAGGIAHDFNNLLTSILGFSDLALQELPPGSAAKELIGESMNGARRAAELTQQMLAYSGRGRFVIEPVDLSRLAADMTRLLQITIPRKCLLEFNLAPDLPPVEADATQMRQIIMNLILNAAEAIGERSGVIAVTTGALHCDRAYLAETYQDDQLADGDYVLLEVVDDGCGMSEETRSKVFDPFFTTKFTGRGLGLSATLGIVRGHRGAIQCSSTPDRGTTFKVLLPVGRSALAARTPADAPTPEWRGSGTVLVVDDEASVLRLARHMLERMGFTVLVATDGREGVEVFRAAPGPIQFVLLDMTMPHLDGEETLREIRQLRGDAQAILMSGFNEQTATRRFAGKGLGGFLLKPFRYEQLMAVVRAVLGE